MFFKMRLLICLSMLCVGSVLPAGPATPATPMAPTEPRADAGEASEEPPEGYYAFVESPNATPPRVRPPPYRQVASECAGAGDARPHVSANNLCGDLNRGLIPRNPMGHNPHGEPYPFELIRNQSLRFLSRALPVLRADDTLPRVAHLQRPPPPQHVHDISNELEERAARSLPQWGDADADARAAELDAYTAPSSELRAEHRALADGDRDRDRADPRAAPPPPPPPHTPPRDSRKFCDGGGVFCMLYRAINGESSSPGGSSVERREDPGPSPGPGPGPHPHRYEGPPTPCPARVEYATPVFARNYQGVWRYVVQIPYEGYFTQTVEVTRCMQSRCHYLEGGCLSSPRWVSLLVAELHYPQEYQQPQQYAQTAATGGTEGGESAGGDKPAVGPAPATHCDGHDEMGCYQVRLYYDWFLVPGSCKCWRPDYFARYVRRRHSTTDL